MVDQHDVSAGALEDWFGNRSLPIEIEVGSGQGKFLCELASTQPSTKFIGIDLNRWRCEIASNRIHNSGLVNVRIVNMEAELFVRQNVPSSLIKALHIYFPTPYPNSLGLTQRLLTLTFLQEAYRVLISGGSLRIVTDHEHYFGEICAHIRLMPWWNISWFPPIRRLDSSLVVGTPWEFFNHKEVFELHLIK